MKKIIKKYISSYLILALMVLSQLFLNGCSLKGFSEEDVKITKSETHFGTIMTITLYGKEKEIEKTIDKCFEKLDELEYIFSAKLEDSELSMVNKRAYNEDVKVSDELFFVFEKALEYCNKTDGAFDISIGQLVDIWGIGTENEKVPAAEEIDGLKGLGGYRFIKLDADNQTVRFTDKRVKVDLGAIAKGYAADVIKKEIKDIDEKIYGVLNFGGNVMTVGSKPSKDKWNIGITDPLNEGELCMKVSIDEKTVVTSGNYERYFEKDGKRYHHILDGKTGYPSDNGVISASIIGESSIDCDALSTACFVLGVDKALSLINSLEDYEAIIIDKDGHFFMSDNADKYDVQKY